MAGGGSVCVCVGGTDDKRKIIRGVPQICSAPPVNAAQLAKLLRHPLGLQAGRPHRPTTAGNRVSTRVVSATSQTGGVCLREGGWCLVSCFLALLLAVARSRLLSLAVAGLLFLCHHARDMFEVTLRVVTHSLHYSVSL